MTSNPRPSRWQLIVRLSVPAALALLAGAAAAALGTDTRNGNPEGLFYLLFAAAVIAGTGLSTASTLALLDQPLERRAEVTRLLAGTILGMLLCSAVTAAFVVAYVIVLAIGVGDGDWDAFDGGRSGGHLSAGSRTASYTVGAVLAGLTFGGLAALAVWGYRYAEKVTTFARAAGWWWRIGLGVPALLGLVLVSAAMITLITGDAPKRQELIRAGHTADYEIATPYLFDHEDVWLVLLETGDFIALTDRGLEQDCPLEWRPDHVFMEASGWFVDACTGGAYDLVGRCFAEGCRGRLLGRYAVAAERGEVIVDLRIYVPPGEPNLAAEPINPP